MIVRDAIRARVPMVVLARMGLNLVVDALLGLRARASATCSTWPTGPTARTSGCCCVRSSASRCASRPTPGYVAGAVALMVVPLLAGVAVAVLGIWLLRALARR